MIVVDSPLAPMTLVLEIVSLTLTVYSLARKVHTTYKKYLKIKAMAELFMDDVKHTFLLLNYKPMSIANSQSLAKALHQVLIDILEFLRLLIVIKTEPKSSLYKRLRQKFRLATADEDTYDKRFAELHDTLDSTVQELSIQTLLVQRTPMEVSMPTMKTVIALKVPPLLKWLMGIPDSLDGLKTAWRAPAGLPLSMVPPTDLGVYPFTSIMEGATVQACPSFGPYPASLNADPQSIFVVVTYTVEPAVRRPTQTRTQAKDEPAEPAESAGVAGSESKSQDQQKRRFWGKMLAIVKDASKTSSGATPASDTSQSQDFETSLPMSQLAVLARVVRSALPALLADSSWSGPSWVGDSSQLCLLAPKQVDTTTDPGPGSQKLPLPLPEHLSRASLHALDLQKTILDGRPNEQILDDKSLARHFVAPLWACSVYCEGEAMTSRTSVEHANRVTAVFGRGSRPGPKTDPVARVSPDAVAPALASALG